MELCEQLAFELGSPKPPTALTRKIALDGKQFEVSEAFDTYWRFAAERQNIFFNRLSSHLPWTTDPILLTYKFTNAYRASDRISQYLINEVIYRGSWSKEDTFFRIILFKIFNKIETWEVLQRQVGQICVDTFRYDIYDRVLSGEMASGRTIYSAAYIMPSGGPKGEKRKHQTHLHLIERMLCDEAPIRISEMHSMQQAFTFLRQYPTIGDFLAYQFVTDLNYSELCDFSEMEFVMPGPGAKDGIRKCFPSLPMEKAADAIRAVTDAQETQFARLGISFRDLWGRSLQLIDCQNLFCEVDKYSRVAHPDIGGISGRTRIKQQFRPTIQSYRFSYPPKWKLKSCQPH